MNGTEMCRLFFLFKPDTKTQNPTEVGLCVRNCCQTNKSF